MGQSAVDLPHPLEQAASANNADDLLSQLAGDEIDRLLAEAEVERPPYAPADEAAYEAAKPATQGVLPAKNHPVDQEAVAEVAAENGAAVSAELDQLVEKLNSNELTAAPAGEGETPAREGEAPAEPPASGGLRETRLGGLTLPETGKSDCPEVPPAAVDLSAELDQLFSQMNEDSAGAEAAPTAPTGAAEPAPAPPALVLTPTPAATTQPVETAEQPAQGLPPAEEATTAAERHALAPADPIAQLETVGPEPGAAAVLDDIEEPLPLYLRPLEWINAPFAACPPTVREAMGKAAVITLVNAIAVLAYVLIFR